MKHLFILFLALVSLVHGETKYANTTGGNIPEEHKTPFKTALSLNNVNNTSDANKPISIAQAAGFAAKQDTLVSGANIKTLNGGSMLGSGNQNLGTVLLANDLVTLDNTGATDESADVQTAIAAAVSGNFKTLAFLPGTYKGNYVLTNAQCEIKIVGAGAGSTGDWTGVEQQGATMFIPNNNALPVWKFEYIRGVTLEDFEVRGNGAGTSVCGILIDNPSSYFAGNGLFMTNVIVRRFTEPFKSMGGCNVHASKSGFFNGNRNIYIPKLEAGLAHSYTFDQCSIGGVTSGVGSGGGTGDGRILHVEDGSFITMLNCEMGNCTDMIYVGGNGPTAAIINVVGGNMETMSGTGPTFVLNTMNGGNFNMTGCRIGTGNKAVLRAIGLTGEIIGICLENNQAQGPMTMLEHYGVSWARLSGNGLNKSVSEYTDSTFTTLRDTSVCERIVASARLTAVGGQPIASGITTVVCNTATKNVGSKYNTTTGIFKPGKRGDYMVTAQARLDSGVVGSVAKLYVYVNGSERGTLDSKTAGGAGTSLTGAFPVVGVGASDEITVRVESNGANTIGTFANFTTQVTFVELGYWN